MEIRYKMNNIDRRIIELLGQVLKVGVVSNPCDIKGLSEFYNDTKPKIEKVRAYIDELTCYDIPKNRIKEIFGELSQK